MKKTIVEVLRNVFDLHALDVARDGTRGSHDGRKNRGLARAVHRDGAFAGRMEYPDLKIKAAAFWNRHRNDAPTMKFCVEDAASGIPLVQEFKRSTNIPIIGVKVDKSKYVRAEAVTPEFESGRIFIPEGAEWLDEWLEEHIGFPSVKHDDYVDTSSGGLAQIKGHTTPYMGLSHPHPDAEAPMQERRAAE